MTTAPDIDRDRSWRLARGARHSALSQLALDCYWRRRLQAQRGGAVAPGAFTLEDDLLVGNGYGNFEGTDWLPDDDGRLSVVIPVLQPVPTLWDGDPAAALVAVDLVAIDWNTRIWARLAGVADTLGWWRSDDSGVRLYPEPWSWLEAVLARRAGPSHACILDESGETAMGLLLERRLGCRDAQHVQAVRKMQRRARARVAGSPAPAPVMLQAAS